MFWNYFKLQKLLDALFDETWFQLGLPDISAGTDALVGEACASA
jgi:hypothetical protein